MSISFELSEELQAVVDAVRGFAGDRIRAHLRDFEAAGALPEDLERECHELGLTTLALPAALGGNDLLDLRAAVLCSEELAWGDLGAAVAIPGPRTAAALALELGSEEQQKRLLSPFADPAAASRRGTAALVEGPFGLEPGAIQTEARRQGEAWVVSGQKRYVQAADRAELTLVLARDPESRAADPWDRLVVLAIEGRAAGLAAGERDRTLGLSTAAFSSLELKGVRVPAANRLGSGQPGEVRQALVRAVARKKLLDAARLVGCCRAACEYAFKYATERKAFGVYLHEHQGLAFMMADMATRTDAIRTLAWQAAWAMDTGQKEEGARLAFQAFRQAADYAVMVTTDAVQVLGGHGYLWDHPVEKWMRDARTLGLQDGLVFAEEDVLQATVAGTGN